jgi:hypothetical protein
LKGLIKNRAEINETETKKYKELMKLIFGSLRRLINP